MSLEGNSRYKEVYILKEPNNYPIKIKPFDKPKKGGEGEIYRVLNSNSSLVAKIYYKDKLKPDHQKKLPILLEIAEKLRIPKRNSFQIAWCVDLVYDSPQRKKIIGFLMQFIRGERIFRAYNPQERQEYFPRFDYGHLHQIAINLAKVFQEIHKHDIVMGDVNESNFLVTNSAEVILIDIDSVQIYDRREYKYYRCTVATRGYKPPELDSYETLRKPEHDLYGLGVLIYKLLMGGMDPFPEIEGEKPSVYKHSRLALPFETLHPQVRYLMQLFTNDGYKNPQRRPTAKSWVLALQEAKQSLKRCSNNERHYYQQHLQKCIWCERAWELKIDAFPPMSGYKDYNPTKTSPAETYNSSGRIYYNQGKYDLAIFEFNQAIRLNPKFAYAYNNRGNVYYIQGKHEKAIADYSQAIRLNPKYANAYYNRGLNYKDNRNIEKAISDFEKAANLCKQQGNQKSHQKCLDQLKRLTKSKPLSTIYNDLSTLNSSSLIDKLNKGELQVIFKFILLIFAVVFPLLVHQPYQQTQVSKETMKTLVGVYGKLKIKQLKSYREACETREPSHDYSYNVENGGVKGLLYPRQCGKEYDNNALEYKFIDTHGSEKCMGRARISLTEKETEVETLWEIQKDASSDTNCSTKGKTYRIRAIDSNVQSKQRKYEKMLTNYNRDIKIKPNSANAYYNRGIVYYNLGKYEKALADYNQAIQLKPYLSLPYHNRAVVYHTQGKLEKALADYNQAILINPKYADTYSGRGLVYHTQGKLEKALADYNQAIFINPKYTDAYYNRGNVYYEQGKYKKAITDYNRAIRLNPTFANAYYNRGLTYMAQGNIKKGMSDFEKAGDL